MAPRQVYFSTSSWKRGLKAKEESPTLDREIPSARVRRRVKWAMTVASMGVNTSPQPKPGGIGKAKGGGGGHYLLLSWLIINWVTKHDPSPEMTPIVR